MRLATVAALPFPYPQGSQVYLREQAEALRRAGADVTLFCYGRGEGEAPPDLVLQRAPRLLSPRRLRSGLSPAKPGADAALALALRRAHARQPFDALLAHNAEAALTTLLARVDATCVYVAHTLVGEELPAYAPMALASALARIGGGLDRVLARRCDGVIALCERARAALAPHAHGPIEVIPPGLAPAAPTDPEGVRAACARRGLTPGGFALYTGNLDAYQDLALLAGAVAPLLPLPVVVATHDAHGRAPAGVRVLELDDPDEGRALLAGCALVLAPRRRAGGFPIKLMNAMQAGRPVVAFAEAAGSLEHGVSAWLLPPGANGHAFGEAAAALVRDPDRAARLGAGARERLCRAHDPDALAARTLAFVARVARRPPGILPHAMSSSPLARGQTPDLRAAARAVAAVADARAGRAGTTVTLPDATVAALRDSHLFALLVPRALGGHEAEPATQIEVFETVARADGSAGWCLMAGAIASGVAAAYTGEAAAQRMFGRGGPVVHAGQLAPRGQATAEADGFRVSGRWSFGSGLAHCQWVLGGCVRVEDGRTRMLPSGLPDMIVVCVPLEQVQMRGNWNVIGLQETGSFDYEVSGVLVPADQAFSLFASEPRRGGALYRMGVLLLTAAGHTGFALGVGRRALDEIAVLAPQRQRLGEETLVDQASFQREYARREARLRAARLLALDAFGEAYRTVEAGDALDLAQRAAVRMATTHVTEVAVEAADFAFRAAGSESLRTPNVIQRCFRDLHAGAQHIFVGDKTWSDAGGVLLGAAPPDLIL